MMKFFSCKSTGFVVLSVGVLFAAGLNAAWLISKSGSVVSSAFVRLDKSKPVARINPVEYERIALGGEFYKELQYVLDYPGIVVPVLADLRDVEVPDSSEVVGVVVDGVAAAFVLSSMLSPTDHVVNGVVNGVPVSVAYCDKVECVRVLLGINDGPIPLRVGGLDINDQLVLMLNGIRYSQQSEGVPLRDHPFHRTTMGEWRRNHPDTKVFQQSDGEYLGTSAEG